MEFLNCIIQFSHSIIEFTTGTDKHAHNGLIRPEKAIRLPPHTMKPTRNRLLVVRLSALGDVAMTIPAIYSLARQHPEVEVCVLTEQKFASLFLEPPANLRLIDYTRQRFSGIGGWWRLCRMLQKEHFAAVADLHNVLRTWLIDAWFIVHGVRTAMLPKRRSERPAILKGKATAEPFVERYYNVFRRLGYDLQPDFAGFFAGQSAAPVANAGKRFRIGLAPFARYTNKTYPITLTEKVIDLLNRRSDTDIYLFGGGKRETDLFRDWQKRFAHVVYISGDKTLADELALMHSLDTMVSMDSANMHLASLTGTRVVSLWGSTTPQCGFLGWKQQPDDALCAALPCQPCTISGSPTCQRKDLACLHAISPDTVVEAIFRQRP